MPYGPAPAESRRRRNEPARGDWQPTEGIGWQHGTLPKAPAGLLKTSRGTWNTWMRSWFAAHWTEDDLPGLEVVIILYDQVRRGEHQRASELRIQMDTYGITPKGQQDRRWKAPPKEKREAPTAKVVEGRWGDLKVADGA